VGTAVALAQLAAQAREQRVARARREVPHAHRGRVDAAARRPDGEDGRGGVGAGFEDGGLVIDVVDGVEEEMEAAVLGLAARKEGGGVFAGHEGLDAPGAASWVDGGNTLRHSDHFGLANCG
jgi:hypothetical protein